MHLLTRPHYELWLEAGAYKVYCYNHRLANKLNAATRQYADYQFKSGDEAIFSGLSIHQLAPLMLSESYVSGLTNSSLSAVLTLETAKGGTRE